MNLPAPRAKLDPQISLSAGAGKRPGKTFGIPRRNVLKIAEAGSTSVFPGIFSVFSIFYRISKAKRHINTLLPV
jgi:hypothetical protein